MLRKVMLLAVVALLVAACGDGAPAPTATPANLKTLRVAYDSSAARLFGETVLAFNAAQIRVGEEILRVEATAISSGDFTDSLTQGDLPYDVIIPADQAWYELLNAWRIERAQTALNFTCTPIARTPVVMITWRAMAEVLGYPEREFTWNDITDLALSPSAWFGYDRPEWGNLSYGHAHPILSHSGLVALLGEAYAVAPLTPTNVGSESVSSYVRAVERSVARYGASSYDMASLMAGRGKNYLHVLIGFESDMARITQPADDQLIAIYPRETFEATFSACGTPNDPYVAAYVNYFQSNTQLVSDAGFRPLSDISNRVPGFDFLTYSVINTPQISVIRQLQDNWEVLKRPLNIALVIDVSGSMGQDGKMQGAIEGALAFVSRMGDQDRISLYTFDSTVRKLIAERRLGDNREEVLTAIRGLRPVGGTALYDATVQVRNEITTRSTHINAIIVLGDGQDTSSQRYSLPQAREAIRTARGTALLYTIGYGRDADGRALEDLASAGNGLYFFAQDAQTIERVYQEIATQVGGSRGAGR